MEQVKRLTRDGFRNWLKAQDGGAVVGEARHGSHCPLANFLGDGCGVAFDQWSDDDHTEKLPEWACTFYRAVDNRAGLVTASRALELLEQVK